MAHEINEKKLKDLRQYLSDELSFLGALEEKSSLSEFGMGRLEVIKLVDDAINH